MQSPKGEKIKMNNTNLQKELYKKLGTTNLDKTAKELKISPATLSRINSCKSEISLSVESKLISAGINQTVIEEHKILFQKRNNTTSDELNLSIEFDHEFLLILASCLKNLNIPYINTEQITEIYLTSKKFKGSSTLIRELVKSIREEK